MSTKGKELPLDFEPTTEPVASAGLPSGVEKRLLRKLLATLNNPPIGVRLWDGKEVYAGREAPEVTLRILDRKALWGLVWDPELYFGDAFSEGRVEIDGDLLTFLRLASKDPPRLGDWRGLVRKTIGFASVPRANTLAGSRRNIRHHYDLSNEFYQLWLDPEYMQYTCAYFPTPNTTLAQAQIAKLHHVCRKLRLKPRDTVVEAGCGWGGLALFMAKHYGAKVRAYNISHEQVIFARKRAQKLGFADQIEYVEDDYRNITGEYDAFVSVGMLEHVGRINYKTLGGVIDRCLREDGRALIHSIGRNQPRLMHRWIEKRIFPGAYPPTIGEMADIFEPYNFSILDIENLRLHYAKTLECWLALFEENAEQIRKMFDMRFVRAWRLYLTGSIAAFLLGQLQLFQVVFNRGTNNDVNWTRDYLYEKPSLLKKLQSRSSFSE